MWLHTALEVEAGWHYARTCSEGGEPIGGCASHPPHPNETDARICFNVWVRSHLKAVELCWMSCDVPGCYNSASSGVGVPEVGICAALCPEHSNMASAVVALGLDRPAGDYYRA